MSSKMTLLFFQKRGMTIQKLKYEKTTPSCEHQEINGYHQHNIS